MDGSGLPRRVRRTQGERSRGTRERLMQATIDVLLEAGYAGLTTAQVDQRAGVSSGARVHHFPTKADLVVAATEVAYEKATELGQRRADVARRSKEPLKHFVDDCLSVYFDWPFIAALEVVLAARSDAELMAKIRPVLGKFHGTMRKTWTDALVDAGYRRPDAEVDLRLTLNLIRGMALNNIWEGDSAEYEKLIKIWSERLPKRVRRVRKQKRDAT